MIKKKIKETDKLNIIDFREIQISSSRASIQMFILAVFVLVEIGFFLWLFFTNNNLNNSAANLLLAIIFGITLVGFTIFLLSKLRTAKIVGDILLIKSFIGESEKIKVINIIYTNTFRMKGSTYLSVKYKDMKKVKSIWIMKPSIFSGSSDVEKVIKFAMHHFKLKIKEVNN